MDDGLPVPRSTDPPVEPREADRHCTRCDRVTLHRRFWNMAWADFWGMCLRCGQETPEP